MSLTTVHGLTKARILQELDRLDLGETDLELFREFVGVALNRVRGPFLAHHGPKQVLRYLRKAFIFALERVPGQVKVSVKGGPSKGLLTMSAMEDQPFIIDTIRLFFSRGNADYWGGFNLVWEANRDEKGRLVGVGQPGAIVESLCMLEADKGDLMDDASLSAASLTRNLELSKSVVRDFAPMTRMVERVVEKCETLGDRWPDKSDTYSETGRFLKWLLRENFVFMGMETPTSQLGIQTHSDVAVSSAPEGEWVDPHPPGTVRVRKSHIESPVHRAGRIDEILISLDGKDGEWDLFIRGMFTYRAVSQPTRSVPIIRKVLARVLQVQGAKPGSYRYKGIANVFDSLPTEYLFTASEEAIAKMVDLVFESEQRQEVGVTLLKTSEDSAFCLVSLPTAGYGDELRRDLENEIVGHLKATYTDHGIFMSRYNIVLLHYFMTGVRFPNDAGVQALTERIRQLATPWQSRLWHALASEFGEAKADYLTETYGRAFPTSWVRNASAELVVRDIANLEALSGNHDVLAYVFQNDEDVLCLRLYQTSNVNLTDILPVFDHFGLVVVSSEAVEVDCRGGILHVDTFVLDTEGDPREFIVRATNLTDAIPVIFSGQVESDPLNQLMITAGLSWRAVDVIRAYIHYIRQLQFSISLPRMQGILNANPKMCGRLIDLYAAMFDPELSDDREALVHEAEEVVQGGMRRILAHDEFIVFSALVGLVHATLRTNLYRTERSGKHLSFKFDARSIKEMPGVKPQFEIYVHGVEVEGVHLRFGPVARGGLRWSDRADYRTEVLGLVTTQQIKNVVIVPVGAKGGFFLRKPATDYPTRRAQADRHYRTFIQGLLDVTDNVIDGKIVKPAGVVCRDGDDPYLVVAADKGTAHLSDTANGISQEYGFWLGDAFASGGSNGYDHKGVGITAKGTWTLVRRHFAEMGRDPYREPFTAVGVGDMSGDVLGNGMIETPHVRLLAAFNHLHVFLDPDPDSSSSFTERVRLFREGRGGEWANYDRSLISEGGGVFDRRAKSMPLSAEAQEMLGISEDEVEPELVIRQILKMDVDLLWNGGIGTYVKAHDETDAQVDDRSNDRVRVDGCDLRARVVGEGGNLGFTQRGRIEAAMRGVRLNTDAIDNSGGVDMSDHEVNLKILLNRVVVEGGLAVPERNRLLAELTDEVRDLVLDNNNAHGRQLSRDHIRTVEDIFPFGRAIEFVERQYGVSRESLFLPTSQELMARAADGLGLTRPELAVLSAYVKMFVYTELMRANPKALTGYHEALIQYFPVRLREKYREEILSHLLADEIAMTSLTTRIVADAGAAFVPLAVESTGRSVFEICDAYLSAQQLARTDEVRSTLEELRSSVLLGSLSRAWVMVDAGAREVTQYWLSSHGRIPTSEELTEMSAAVDEVYSHEAEHVASRNRDVVADLEAHGVPENVIELVLKAQYLNIALMVWSHSKRLGRSFHEMVVRQLAVGRASRLQAVVEDLRDRPASGRWDPIAIRILHHRYQQALRRLVRLTPTNGDAKSIDALAASLAEGALADVRQQVDEILAEEEGEVPSLATLLVLEERVASSISRMSRIDRGSRDVTAT